MILANLKMRPTSQRDLWLQLCQSVKKRQTLSPKAKNLYSEKVWVNFRPLLASAELLQSLLIADRYINYKVSKEATCSVCAKYFRTYWALTKKYLQKIYLVFKQIPYLPYRVEAQPENRLPPRSNYVSFWKQNNCSIPLSVSVEIRTTHHEQRTLPLDHYRFQVHAFTKHKITLTEQQ